MEKSGLDIKLPPGFRFHPTDQELVVQYLLRKVLSYPLPASVISDIQLSSYDPWNLPSGGVGCGEKERYLFNYREGGSKGRFRRAAGSGYWKVRGKDKEVTVGRHVVGLKRVMVFYRGKPSNGSRTDWVLHEYSLLKKKKTSTTTTTTATTTQMEGWVLCRVFQEGERHIPNNHHDSAGMSNPLSNQDKRRNQIGDVDCFTKRDDHLLLLDQEMESSCVTQVSDDFTEQEEEEEQVDSSTCNSLESK